jgi:mannosyltransferase OCH1-like enzyme
MIPRLIHQTWKSEQLPPKVAPFANSWQRHNPSWERILWTDRMLLTFVSEHYPHLFELYCSYSNPVSRADAARYMLLHKFGGFYADIDVECLAPLDPIANETRAVLCHEPPSHWPMHAPYRSHPFLIFNGVMAGPADHPLWTRLLERLPLSRYGDDVLDQTGPCFLTGIYLDFEDKASIALHNSQLFTPTDSQNRQSPPYGSEAPEPLTRHDWQCSWWTPDRSVKSFRNKLKTGIRRTIHRWHAGKILSLEDALKKFDTSVIGRPPPAGERVAVLVPARNAIGDIDGFIDAISKIDLNKSKTKIVFCEGDSTDGTFDLLNKRAAGLREQYREVVVLKKDVGTRVARDQRWNKKLQRTRRAGIAVVRNYLIDHGLDDTDDWALWIDVDMWKLPPDLFQKLRQSAGRIVAPNCVKFSGGPTFDLNTFVSNWQYEPDFYYKHVKGGLFQPPARARGRLHLDQLRHTARVELDAVGGTTLLVDASLHRAGLRFPEVPYKDLIETEAFGLLAKDVGVRPIGLPQLEVFHVP